MPTLYLLRHAQAAVAQEGPDAGRPLTEAGRAQATAVGEWFARCPQLPQRILCSTAERTRETHAALRLDVPVAFSERIYMADPGELISLLQEQEEHTQRVLLIGHNPGMYALANGLSGSADSPRDLERLAAGFSPASLAVLRVCGRWCDLKEGAAVLEAFIEAPIGQ